MPFRRFNRGLNLRPVQRIKHVVDSQFAVVGGTPSVTTVIQATDTPTLAATSSVQTGSTVHGIFLVIEVVNTEATQGVLPNVYLAVFLNRGGNLTNIDANAVGSNDDKRYVIHQEMIMLQKQSGSNPRTLFKGVIILPRGYKRFGPNDLLNIIIDSPGIDLDACLQVHYKEFR